MSEARQGHVGKTRQERQAYLNKLKGGGATSETPSPYAATDELPEDRDYPPRIPTRRSPAVRQTVQGYIKEHVVESIFTGLLAVVIAVLGYLFIEYAGINREVGEISTFVQEQARTQNKALERVEKQIDSAVKEIKDRLSRSEARLDRHFESNSHHSSP